MSPTPQLALVRGDRVVARVPLPPSGLRVGRGPDNDLVLADADVSRHHLDFWWFDGALWVRDLGSRNGSRVGQVPLDAARPLADGDEVLAGNSALLRVENVPEVEAAAPETCWVVEDVDAGLRHLVPSRGPDDPRAAWRPTRAPELALWVDDRGPRLQRGEAPPELLEPGDLDLGGRRHRLRLVRPVREVTVGDSGDGWPYELVARLDGPGGPTATLIPMGPQGAATTITAETRATLLWILGRKRLRDAGEGLPAESSGWLDDDEAVSGVWGRRGQTMDVNSLHVLVYRLRRDLKAAGLDAACLEKRRGALRLNIARVALLDG